MVMKLPSTGLGCILDAVPYDPKPEVFKRPPTAAKLPIKAAPAAVKRAVPSKPPAIPAGRTPRPAVQPAVRTVPTINRAVASASATLPKLVYHVDRVNRQELERLTIKTGSRLAALWLLSFPNARTAPAARR